jgi:MoaA/NifB/PqqE/SkfB family radical SAM enzyme
MQQFQILEFFSKKPYTFNEIFQKTSLNKNRLKSFLSQEIKFGTIIEGNFEEFSPVQIPPRQDSDAYKGFPSPFLSAPTTIDLFLTRACNLKCCHCFANGGSPLKNELTNEEWLSVFDQIEKMGVLQVRLNGGEPFMRRGIYEILSFLRHKRFQKLMITNGTLLTKDAIDALMQSGITPTISLDGATSTVHDNFRGVPGAFKRTLKAIERLKLNGISFGLNTCVHFGNIGQIEDIIRLGSKLGASRIGLLSIEPVGRSAETETNMISEIEYIFLSLKFRRLAKKYENEIEVTQEILPSEIPLKSIGVYSCSIDSDGSVYPTNRVLGDFRFKMGSVREKNFSEIWFSQNWIPFRIGHDKNIEPSMGQKSWKSIVKLGRSSA